MQPTIDSGVSSAADSLARRVYRNLAAQDWLVNFYFLGLFTALSLGNGLNRGAAFRMVAIDFAILWVTLFLTRGELLKGVTGGTFYRVGLTLPVALSYFQLRTILPAVTLNAFDAQIYAFDMRVFHYEPSVAWDRFVTPATTEWFAFFYFGYFAILTAHALPFIVLAKDGPLLRHFGFGILLQFTVSHTLYMVVPGWGPYHELHFEHELVGGTFWNLVVETVRAGGAMKDIFPSLHTGAPLFFALFSFIHRKKMPFRYTWPITAFCVTQIVIATMFLRWHYLVDIFAGIALACVSAFGGAAIVRWEEKRRASLGVQSVFGLAPLDRIFRVKSGSASIPPRG